MLDLYRVYRPVQQHEREAARAAHEAGHLYNNWNCPSSFKRHLATRPMLDKPPKAWAKSVGWPTPLMFFEKHFLQTLLGDDAHFRLAMSQGGVELFVPIEAYQVPAKDVARWTEWNTDPANWNHLAEEFRDLCRVLKLGVQLTVADRTYTDAGTFYNAFVCKHFRNLEEGADIFILD